MLEVHRKGTRKLAKYGKENDEKQENQSCAQHEVENIFKKLLTSTTEWR
jgi:hypothetical protein